MTSDRSLENLRAAARTATRADDEFVAAVLAARAAGHSSRTVAAATEGRISHVTVLALERNHAFALRHVLDSGQGTGANAP